MIKRFAAILTAALVLSVVASTALADGAAYNQEWYWRSRCRYDAGPEKEKYEAVLAGLIAEPEQRQTDDDRVRVVIQDAAWVPEAGVFTVSVRATVKEPECFELHSLEALDTEEAEPWLWRMDIGTEDTEAVYGRIPGWGPVREMMDDSGKRLLLVDFGELTLTAGAPNLGLSTDVFRTPDGDVVCLIEGRLDWLSGDYDDTMRRFAEEHPERRERTEALIREAQAARSRLQEDADSGMTEIRFSLDYTVAEYPGDADAGGRVDFTVCPKAP